MHNSIQEKYKSLNWSDYLRIGRVVQSKLTDHFGFINNINVDEIGTNFTIYWEDASTSLIDLEDDFDIILENIKMYDKFINILSKKLIEEIIKAKLTINDSMILEYEDK